VFGLLSIVVDPLPGKLTSEVQFDSGLLLKAMPDSGSISNDILRFNDRLSSFSDSLDEVFEVTVPLDEVFEGSELFINP